MIMSVMQAVLPANKADYGRQRSFSGTKLGILNYANLTRQTLDSVLTPVDLHHIIC